MFKSKKTKRLSTFSKVSRLPVKSAASKLCVQFTQSF